MKKVHHNLLINHGLKMKCIFSSKHQFCFLLALLQGTSLFIFSMFLFKKFVIFVTWLLHLFTAFLTVLLFTLNGFGFYFASYYQMAGDCKLHKWTCCWTKKQICKANHCESKISSKNGWIFLLRFSSVSQFFLWLSYNSFHELLVSVLLWNDFSDPGLKEEVNKRAFEKLKKETSEKLSVQPVGGVSMRDEGPCIYKIPAIYKVIWIYRFKQEPYC